MAILELSHVTRPRSEWYANGQALRRAWRGRQHGRGYRVGGLAGDLKELGLGPALRLPSLLQVLLQLLRLLRPEERDSVTSSASGRGLTRTSLPMPEEQVWDESLEPTKGRQSAIFLSFTPWCWQIGVLLQACTHQVRKLQKYTDTHDCTTREQYPGKMLLYLFILTTFMH